MTTIIARSYDNRYRPSRLISVCPGRVAVQPVPVVSRTYCPITRTPVTTQALPASRLHSELELAVARVYSHFPDSPKPEPRVVHGVTPLVWARFREKHRQNSLFRLSRWEYDGARQKMISIPLAKPLHDIGIKVMTRHVYIRMIGAGIDTEKRIESLYIDRESFEKLSESGTTSSREPDCAIWTRSYENGIVPTMVWEVGHSQTYASLLRRAKMWARRYDGKVQVIVLVKYLCRNPRLRNDAVLFVFRPAWSAERNKWIVLQDGPLYTLFPRPAGIVPGVYDNPLDAIPLTYKDYFGPGNVGPGLDGDTRFDLPLERIRDVILDVIPITVRREGFRYVSGGSSVPGDLMEEDQVRVADIGAALVEDRDSPDEGAQYGGAGNDWDEWMSDVSDA